MYGVGFSLVTMKACVVSHQNGALQCKAIEKNMFYRVDDEMCLMKIHPTKKVLRRIL